MCSPLLLLVAFDWNKIHLLHREKGGGKKNWKNEDLEKDEELEFRA